MIHRQQLFRIVSVIAVAGMLQHSPAFAQEPGPGTEPATQPVAAGAGISAGEPDGNSAGKRAASPQSTNATFSYYTVAGTALKPRSSTTQYTYDGAGCMHITASADYLNVDMHLPEGSVIKYVRVYYNDTSNAGAVTGFLTRYEPGVVGTDLANAGSTAAFNSGVGSSLSSEITETVDNSTYGYALLGITAVGATTQLCGIRVAYYAPPFWASFTPAILRQSP